MKLFRVITLALVLLTSVPLGVIGYILINSSADSIKTLTWELQQERADNAAQASSAFFENTIGDLDLLLSNFSVASMNLQQRQELLSLILQKRPELNIIAFYDVDGKSLPKLLAFDSNHILPSELSDHQTRASGIRFTNESITFSAPYTIKRPARPAVSIAARNETAVFMAIEFNTGGIGFLGMELSLSSLQSRLDRVPGGDNSDMMLITDAGFIIAHKKGQTGTKFAADRLASLLADTVARPDPAHPGPRVSGARPVRMDENLEVLAAYSPLARPAWTMVSVEPLAQAYAASQKMTWQVITVVLISLCVAIFLGVLFAFGITRPIRKLVSGALAIARGKFGTSLEIQTRNEIGELAHTFNYMSRRLLEYDQTNTELMASLERGYLETIRALANSIDAKDPYTRGHSTRVTNVAIALGKELGLED